MSERERFIYQVGPSIGLWGDDARQALRDAQVLHTWAVHECNGTIQRDESDGRCYWYSDRTGERIGRTPDRESGAVRRLTELAKLHGLTFVHQGDPRGWVARFRTDDGREVGIPSRG